MHRMPLVVGVVVLSLLLATRAAVSQSIELEQPESGFVLDLAELLSADEERSINELSQQLTEQHRTPIVVVTIDAMADHWRYGDIRIETFAHLLFDQWEIGPVDPNRGILLLVSQGDRKARIQLGDGWGRRHDTEARRIMDRRIVPRFKQGDFAAGIMAGVEALAEMAQQPERAASSSPTVVPPADAASPPAAGASPGSRAASSPPITLPPGRSYGEVSGPSVRSVVFTALGCGGVILLIVVIAYFLFRASSRRDPSKSYRNRVVPEHGRAGSIRDEQPDAASAAAASSLQQPALARRGDSGFLGGLLGGLLFSGFSNRGGSSWSSHRSRSSSGFGSSFGGSSFGSSFGSGGGGFSSGSSFGGGGGGGGGFSGGGGATGSW